MSDIVLSNFSQFFFEECLLRSNLSQHNDLKFTTDGQQNQTSHEPRSRAFYYAGSRSDFLRQKSSDIFWRAFFGREISGEALLVYNFVTGNWLLSGFINPPPLFGFFSFPRKESFDLNRLQNSNRFY